ncbi:MAG TPA: biopolymer transporter ExbD, partial [Verrucomicrobiae bacterium]|nr:biopolymer transporter ExbD [Verrucomicrobiae bacterium]
MSEINITPLLDLGFVLLVIFIITTAPIANDAKLDLPRASKSIREPPPKAVSVTVDSVGNVSLNS